MGEERHSHNALSITGSLCLDPPSMKTPRPTRLCLLLGSARVSRMVSQSYPNKLNSFKKEGGKKKCADLVCKSEECKSSIETKVDHADKSHVFCAYKISIVTEVEEVIEEEEKTGCLSGLCSEKTTDRSSKKKVRKPVDHFVSVCFSSAAITK